MKNRKTLYLLVGVIVIYSLIALRFYMVNNDDDIENTSLNVTTGFEPKLTNELVIFKIKNDYRDPFFDSYDEPVMYRNTKKKSSRKKSSKDSVVFPKIGYKGLVSDSNGKDQVFAVEIGGNEYLVSKGDVIEGVELIDGSPSVIKLKFKKVNRNFKLK